MLFAICGCAQIGFTPLHEAALNGKPECVRLLVERGADKEAKDDVRAPTHVTAAARCVGARRVRRFVSRGLRSVWGCAVTLPDRVARAASPPRPALADAADYIAADVLLERR